MEILVNLFADILGIWTGGSTFLWLVSRKIRILGKSCTCSKCNRAFVTSPRIYKSCDYPVTRSWRTPSIIAEFTCSHCGACSDFLFTDDNCLSPIQASGRAATEALFEVKAQ